MLRRKEAQRRDIGARVEASAPSEWMAMFLWQVSKRPSGRGPVTQETGQEDSCME